MLFREAMFDDQSHFQPILACRTDHNSLQFGVKCFRPIMAHTRRRCENKISRSANGFQVIIPLSSHGLLVWICGPLLTGHNWLDSQLEKRFIWT